MIISRFRKADDNQPTAWEGTWREFREDLIGVVHTPYSGDKLKSPAFSPAHYPEGAKRALRNVVDVQLAVYDYDHATLRELKGIANTLRDANISHVVYSSYSYQGDPDEVRARVVIDLTRPVLPAEWPFFWAYLGQQLGGEFDTQCKDASRLFFLAYTPNTQDAFIWGHDGEALDVDGTLRAAYAEGFTITGAGAGGDGEDPDAPNATAIDVDMEVLNTHIKHLANKRNGRDQMMAALLKCVSKGDSYAEDGARHNTMCEITNHMVYQWPRSSPESVLNLLEGSHRRMYKPDELPAARQDALLAIQGALNLMDRKSAEKREESDNNNRAILRGVFAAVQPGREHPYTEAEVVTWAEEAGVSVIDFSQRWLVLFGSGVYHFIGGRYLHPYSKEASKIQVRKDLLPATAVGVQLQKRSETGDLVDVPFEKLVERYGSTAVKASASLVAQRTVYDAQTRTIVEAVRPRRELTAQRSPLVEEWLAAMAGDKLDVLLAWLSESRKLERPLAALYLQGPPGSGKTMLANGLARVWGTSGPTRADDVTGDGFNEAIVNNPVVFADEYVPAAWMGKQGFAKFREFIVSRTRSLSRKYISSIPLEGCVHVVLAANNDELLQSGGANTDQDRAAVVERLCEIKVSFKAVEFLATLTRDDTARIWNGDEMARHVVWLEENHISPWARLRFGVPADSSELHNALKLNHKTNRAVAEWLVQYVLNPGKLGDDNHKKHRVRIEDGLLFVHWTALSDQEAWSAYVASPREVPESRALQNAIGEFADPEHRRQFDRVDYRIVKLDQLVTAAGRFELGTGPQLEEALSRASAREKRLQDQQAKSGLLIKDGAK